MQSNAFAWSLVMRQHCSKDLAIIIERSQAATQRGYFDKYRQDDVVEYLADKDARVTERVKVYMTEEIATRQLY